MKAADELDVCTDSCLAESGRCTFLHQGLEKWNKTKLGRNNEHMPFTLQQKAYGFPGVVTVSCLAEAYRPHAAPLPEVAGSEFC